MDILIETGALALLLASAQKRRYFFPRAVSSPRGRRPGVLFLLGAPGQLFPNFSATDVCAFDRRPGGRADRCALDASIGGALGII
jgi:hypothetical protein